MNDRQQVLTELANSVNDSRFTITKFSTGYDLDDVDDFLDRIAAQLTAGSTLDELLATISQVTFRETRWRDGYRSDQVDSFIDQLAASIQSTDTPPAASM